MDEIIRKDKEVKQNWTRTEYPDNAFCIIFDC